MNAAFGNSMQPTRMRAHGCRGPAAGALWRSRTGRSRLRAPTASELFPGELASVARRK